MSILDMFDKLDDIVYKPVETICEWVKEPLRCFENSRQQKVIQLQANIEKDKMLFESELQKSNAMAAAKLKHDQETWEYELKKEIEKHEDERRDQLVESLKNYQIELATASRDIVESIGKMSLSLRASANDLIIEKTTAFKTLRDDSISQSKAEIEDAMEMFGVESPFFKDMYSQIMNERRSMVDMTTRFIQELSDDLKRLNANTDELMRMGMQNVNSYLAPMAGKININLDTNIYDNSKLLENDGFIQ